MEWITDLLTSAVSGGVTGLIGSIFSGFFMWRESVNKRKHELDLGRLALEERKLEGEQLLQQIKANSEANIAMAEMGAFTNSINADRKTYSGRGGKLAFLLTIVDFIRGLTRPALTAFLVYLVASITWDMVDALGGYDVVIKELKSLDLVERLIMAIIYMATSATLWWFGSRQLQKSFDHVGKK
ncbi:transmembrane helix protein [Vibrio phage vB_VhaS-VHB1]|nr:transmembrane helix protein [Vibrio phage vB_VhaS-VHB1]